VALPVRVAADRVGEELRVVVAVKPQAVAVAAAEAVPVVAAVPPAAVVGVLAVIVVAVLCRSAEASRGVAALAFDPAAVDSTFAGLGPVTVVALAFDPGAIGRDFVAGSGFFVGPGPFAIDFGYSGEIPDVRERLAGPVAE